MQQEAASIGSDCPTFAMSLRSREHEESFDSPHDFLVRVSPEMLRRFTYAECHVGGSLSISLVFQRRRFPWQRGIAEGAHVKVTVPGPAESSPGPRVMGALIREMGRGYKPYWGSSDWPETIAPRGIWVKHASLVRQLLLGILGVMLGGVLGLLMTRLFEGAPPAWGVSLAASTLLLPAIVNVAVPNIELAALGHTRAVILTRRLIALSVAAVGPPVAAFLFG
jgi:hypothetical protein